MKIYSLINNKYNDLLLYVVLFFSIYLGRDTLIVSSIIGFYRSQFILYFILFLYVVIFIITNFKFMKEILFDFRIKFLLVITIAIILPMIVKKDYTLMYFSILQCIYLAVFISFCLPIRKLCLYFVNIIFALSLISLVCTYVISPVMYKLEINFNIFSNSSGLEFRNLILCFPVNRIDYIRNFGIFREPGVYQFFLTLSIICEIVIIERKVMKKVLIMVILFLTIFSTFSTNGLLQALLLLFVIYIYYDIYKNKTYNCILFTFMLFLGLCATVIIDNKDLLYWSLYTQIGKLTHANDSLLARISSISANYSMFIKHPLVGNSIENVMTCVEHNTSSSLIIFSGLGVFNGIIHILTYISMFLNSIKSKKQFFCKIVMMFVIFVSINTQNLITNNTFWLIPIVSFLTIIYKKLFS